jgi:hypothetical protein
MRDRRFVAAHRGGPLEPHHHRLLAAWAADCAEHVLPLFDDHIQDERPRRAVAAARKWAEGGIKVGEAQKAAVAAHAAAREAGHPAAIAAARATGHAAATAHCADHSLGAAHYALKAVAANGGSPEAERTWQIARLAAALRGLVVSALEIRFGNPSGKPTGMSPQRHFI